MKILKNYSGVFDVARFLQTRQNKNGLPAEALIYIGEALNADKKTKISSMEFDRNITKLHKEISQEGLLEMISEEKLYWIHIEGIWDKELMKLLGEHFKLSSLQLADVMNTDHHPKIEDLNELVFAILKSVHLSEDAIKISYNHWGIFLGKNFVLSFSQKDEPLILATQKRLENVCSRTGNVGTDLIFYCIMDNIIDQYFVTLEKLGSEVEKLEHQVVSNPEETVLNRINHLKIEFLYLEKAAGPLRDFVTKFKNLSHDLFTKKTSLYFSDTFDHCLQIQATINNYRAMLADLLQVYMGTINLITNKRMTFLTVFASIFIPLTFIVGVYGMNFRYMPELTYKYGYPLIMLFMLLLALSFWIYFKRKKWI